MTDTHLNVESIEGREARISCSASGLPPPKYEFYKVSIEAIYTVSQSGSDNSHALESEVDNLSSS